MKITFIGLGIMGSRMAGNLLENGVDVTVFNRSKDPVEALLEKGESVSQVAYAVGFSSLAYFTKSFKEQFGT